MGGQRGSGEQHELERSFWSLVTVFTAVGAEKIGESGGGGRAAPFLTGALGSLDGLNAEPGPQHLLVFGLH